MGKHKLFKFLFRLITKAIKEHANNKRFIVWFSKNFIFYSVFPAY